MHKKIAVYANGWSPEALTRILEGVGKYTAGKEYDIFVFTSHASYSGYDSLNQGELNIYKLGQMEDFDGLIICSNMLNSDTTVMELCEKAKELKVPAVSIGMDIEGVLYAEADNTVGMYQLMEHLVTEHQVKRAVYIGGTPDHVDSIARLRIAREVLAKYGHTIEDSDIYYADWGYQKVIPAIQSIVSDPKGLPDVIICANDYTALAACSELELHGLHVPEDVLVTGFDYLEVGKCFYPSITSVELDYVTVGYHCCELLFGEGKNGEIRKMKAPSRMALAESCGCKGEIDFEEKRHQFCRMSYVESLRGELLNQMERSIEDGIGNSVDYETLQRNLRRHYLSAHLFEGEEFHLMLDSTYYSNLQEDDSGLHLEEYDPEMDVLVSLKNGEILEQKTVSRQQLIPGYDGEGDVHIYWFIPIHIDQFNLGYVVAVDRPLLIQNGMLYSYVERLRQELQKLRVTMRLDTMNKNLTALYNKDAMTGLYNRFGYEGLAIPMFKRSLSMKENLTVFFVDINYMKKINDRFGHLQGDIAIQIVANAIKYSLRKDWIGIRYGGDEFLIIASQGEESKAEEIKQEIHRFVKTEKEHRDLPYDLSVSIGYVITDHQSPMTIQDYVKEADQGMYEIKKALHAKDDQTK